MGIIQIYHSGTPLKIIFSEFAHRIGDVDIDFQVVLHLVAVDVGEGDRRAQLQRITQQVDVQEPPQARHQSARDGQNALTASIVEKMRHSENKY